MYRRHVEFQSHSFLARTLESSRSSSLVAGTEDRLLYAISETNLNELGNDYSDCPIGHCPGWNSFSHLLRRPTTRTNEGASPSGGECTYRSMGRIDESVA